MARTKLRNIRLELQARLGFGAYDNPNVRPIMTSFINDAEAQLYAIGRFKTLSHVWDFNAAIGSANVAFPTDSFGTLNPDKLVKLEVDIGSGTPYWREVTEGITTSDRNMGAIASDPVHYEIREDGFELSPARDRIYAMRAHGIKERVNLENDDQYLVIEKSLVFAVALANAKSHYKHADAQLYLSKANTILNESKWANTGKGKIFRPPGRCAQVPPKPVVV